MPQMAPMMWLSLMLMFLLLFMIFNMFHYFNFIYKNYYNNNLYSMKKMHSFNWQW